MPFDYKNPGQEFLEYEKKLKEKIEGEENIKYNRDRHFDKVVLYSLGEIPIDKAIKKLKSQE